MIMTDSRQHKFRALIEAHSDDLYRYACWLCKDADMARDLVQEAGLRAWKALDKLRDAQAAKGWLFTILRREFHRSLERKQLPTQELDESIHGIAAPGYDTRPEAFQLRRALAGLAEDYREPLVLQVLGGFSCRDIAAMMDISEAAVMTRLFRARKTLRTALEGDVEQKRTSR